MGKTNQPNQSKKSKAVKKLGAAGVLRMHYTKSDQVNQSEALRKNMEWQNLL